MKAGRFVIALVACGSFALAACGGAQTRTPLVCPVPLFPIAAVMMYPEDGATGVPDGNFPLVLARDFGTAISLDAGSAPATGTLTPAPVPSPLPSPAGTPIPGATPVAFSVPTLNPSTTYSVVATFTSAQCAPASQSLGTFTTR